MEHKIDLKNWSTFFMQGPLQNWTEHFTQSQLLNLQLGGGDLLRTMTFKYDLKNFKSTSFYKSGVKLYFEPTKKEVGH